MLNNGVVQFIGVYWCLGLVTLVCVRAIRAEIEQCRWDPTNCADYNSYIVRVNSEFQKLGARGVTVRS